MARTDQPFIQIPWSFDEHAKTEELSDGAYRAFISALTFCARNGTDGAITTTQARKRFTPKVLRELLAAPFMYETATGYQMHEYGEHQMTTADRADLREKRAAAGAAGGKAKAERRRAASNSVASATANEQQIMAEVEVEEELELPLQEQTPLPPAPRRAAAKPKTTGTRVPENWVPDPAMIAWAREHCPGITPQQLDHFHRRFMDHWENATGKAGTKLNWLRTWQNWVETDWQRIPRTGGGTRPGGSNRAADRLDDSRRTIAHLQALEASDSPSPGLAAFAPTPRQIGLAR